MTGKRREESLRRSEAYLAEVKGSATQAVGQGQQQVRSGTGPRNVIAYLVLTRTVGSGSWEISQNAYTQMIEPGPWR